MQRLPNVHELKVDGGLAYGLKAGKSHRDLQLFSAIETMLAPRLTRLEISASLSREPYWTPILDDLLARAANLKTLVLGCFEFSNAWATELMCTISSSASLQQVTLRGCSLDARPFVGSSQLTTSQVTVLDIQYPSSRSGGSLPGVLSPLPFFPNLTKLTLDFADHYFKAIDCDTLVIGCHHLTDLSITATEAFEIFGQFTRLSLLQRIKLAMPFFDDDLYHDDQEWSTYIRAHSGTLKELSLPADVLSDRVRDKIDALCATFHIRLTWSHHEEIAPFFTIESDDDNFFHDADEDSEELGRLDPLRFIYGL